MVKGDPDEYRSARGVIASPVLDPEARAANVEFTQSSRRRQKTPRSRRDTHLSSSRSTRDAVVGEEKSKARTFDRVALPAHERRRKAPRDEELQNQGREQHVTIPRETTARRRQRRSAPEKQHQRCTNTSRENLAQAREAPGSGGWGAKFEVSLRTSLGDESHAEGRQLQFSYRRPLPTTQWDSGG